MKNKTVDAKVVWKQFEDVLVPRLGLSVIDRAVYSHLFRHSQLEGKRRIRFTILWLAHGIRRSIASARPSVRRLIELGALRLMERTKAGHVVEVRLPHEIRAARPEALSGGNRARSGCADKLEETDFRKSKELRQAIHARERGRCFYCQRRLTARSQSLDHVVPLAQFGRNSYLNLVSCCQECNAQKGDRPAKDYVRWLYREERLSSVELTGRLRALKALVAGRMKPTIIQANDLVAAVRTTATV